MSDMNRIKDDPRWRYLTDRCREILFDMCAKRKMLGLGDMTQEDIDSYFRQIHAVNDTLKHMEDPRGQSEPILIYSTDPRITRPDSNFCIAWRELIPQYQVKFVNAYGFGAWLVSIKSGIRSECIKLGFYYVGTKCGNMDTILGWKALIALAMEEIISRHQFSSVDRLAYN